MSGKTVNLPRRKPTRIRGFDYNANKLYFVTICTKGRRKILSDIVGDDAHIVQSEYGLVVEKYIVRVPEIEKYVIMPNHIHLIIRLEEPENPDKDILGRCGHRPLQSNRVSSIVRSLKTLVTKEIGEAVFQRSFHDHIIRGEKDYRKIYEYIDSNPSIWKEDCFYKENL